jgi:DNA-binding CsgD family transcriptional regulator
MFKSNKDVKRLLEMREKTLNNDELKALEKIMAHIVKCIKIANNTVDNYIKHIQDASNHAGCFNVSRSELKHVKGLGEYKNKFEWLSKLIRHNHLEFQLLLAQLFNREFSYVSEPAELECRSDCINKNERIAIYCINPHCIQRVPITENSFDWDSLINLPDMDKLGPFLSETESVPSPHSGSPQSDEHYGLFTNIPPIAQQPPPTSPRPPGGCKPPSSWCTIFYYEYSERVGDSFTGSSDSSKIIVDGFTGPVESHQPRFSLGVIGHINRKMDAEFVRVQIGSGIELSTERGAEGNTDYFIENLSDNSVFIQVLL